MQYYYRLINTQITVLYWRDLESLRPGQDLNFSRIRIKTDLLLNMDPDPQHYILKLNKNFLKLEYKYQRITYFIYPM